MQCMQSIQTVGVVRGRWQWQEIAQNELASLHIPAKLKAFNWIVCFASREFEAFSEISAPHIIFDITAAYPKRVIRITIPIVLCAVGHERIY